MNSDIKIFQANYSVSSDATIGRCIAVELRFHIVIPSNAALTTQDIAEAIAKFLVANGMTGSGIA